MMIFGTSEQLFAKIIQFQKNRKRETYTVEFVETK